jgi:NTP pyrophosphatase (non-canonical NTP hydrolase)
MDLTEIVLAAVRAERIRQTKLWGVQRHDMGKWLAILAEEFGEVAQAVQPLLGLTTTKETDADNLDEELIQLAAVAIATAEQLRETRPIKETEKQPTELSEIKEKVQAIKKLFVVGDFIEGDSLLIELFEGGDIDRLIQEVENIKPLPADKPPYMDLDDE